MRVLHTAHFWRAYRKAPAEVQRAFDKQSLLLLQNVRHPSLRVKKYDDGEDTWQARVTKDWRFYFQIVGDAYIVTDIVTHPK